MPRSRKIKCTDVLSIFSLDMPAWNSDLSVAVLQKIQPSHNHSFYLSLSLPQSATTICWIEVWNCTYLVVVKCEDCPQGQTRGSAWRLAYHKASWSALHFRSPPHRQFLNFYVTGHQRLDPPLSHSDSETDFHNPPYHRKEVEGSQKLPSHSQSTFCMLWAVPRGCKSACWFSGTNRSCRWVVMSFHKTFFQSLLPSAWNDFSWTVLQGI